MVKRPYIMSLKTTLMLLSTVWLIFILLAFNVFTYFFVVRLTTKSEIQLLWKKAGTILSLPAIHQPWNWNDANLLGENLVSGEIIRIIDEHNIVKNQVYSNDELLKHPPVYHDTFFSEVVNTGETRMIFVQVPLVTDNDQTAVLEIGRVMNLLDDYVGILVTALMITTGGAIVLSLAGGYFYSRFLFQPITQLADTMQAIQESGVFRKLDMGKFSKSDEIWKLGVTFNRMMDSLERNFQKQRQFVEDASHELRTPLTIIESYSELLKRWGQSDPEIRKEAVEAVYTEAIRMKNLVSSLMQVIDSDSHQIMEWKRIDLVAIVKAAVRSMRHSFQRIIECRTMEQSVLIDGDAEKIKQVMIILLDNALKYSRKKIRVEIIKTNTCVQVSVLDLGLGIPADRIPMLFDRFYRVDKARSRKTGGFGLGLAIARNIIHHHGGTIRIRSKKNIGTKVDVCLPFNQAEKIRLAEPNNVDDKASLPSVKKNQ